MAWIITKDYIGVDGGDIGLSSDPPPTIDLIEGGKLHPFKLYDDDNNLYYEGLSTSNDNQAAFGPLDWAKEYAGCTTIKYLVNGKWEEL